MKKSCDLCKGDITIPVATIGEFSIVKCSSCGLVYVDAVAYEEGNGHIYTEEYYHNEGLARFDSGKFYGYSNYIEDEENIRLTFCKRLNTIENLTNGRGRLLDIGCAMGFLLDEARKRGWKVVGTEVSSYSVTYAREKLNLEVYLGKLKELNFPTQFFDVVTMWDVIEHVASPLEELYEVHRILKPGGLISIITPDVDSLFAKFLHKRWEEFQRVKEHLYFFSKKTLKNMLEKVGFKICKVESATKYFYLGDIIKRLRVYDSFFTTIICNFIHKLRLEKVRININPFTKLSVYAYKENS
jgi:2-polyprenyl-3-methyl-5-hydroxy-6-metoxy-1,4-benzoquinol methylase